ncbi:hypothetical protein ACGFY6_29040 [Streptomyces sp. NPDC048387]|uniref:hypothetical protein n=1 Tax=Streptomyces sp. NPDC048387 TaxID=3365542 RepID=UPI00371CE4D6
MTVEESVVRSPVLVVGGTGMLAGVVRRLVREGLTTVVVARRSLGTAAFGGLGTADGLLIPVSADYTEPVPFAEALRRTVARTGPFRQAVLWVHAQGRPQAYAAVAGTLADDALVIEVLGSGAAAPSAPEPHPPEPLGRFAYRSVVLGWQGAGPNTRWLDHAEISSGVLAALRASRDGRPDAGPHVVGRVRPWTDRPSA